MSLLLAIFLFFTPQVVSAQVSLSEISPTTDTEWIELQNSSDSAVILTGWKFQKVEVSGDKLIPNHTEVGPRSSCIIEFPSGFLSNSEPRTVKLVDQSGAQIDIALPYPANLPNTLSWTRQPDSSWSQVTPSKSNLCLIATPTSTPTPTNTSTPTNTPVPSNTSTPSVTPTITSSPTPTSEPIRITIDNLPSSASLGNTFTVRFIVSHASPNTDYYVKAYGGINDNYYLETQNGTSWYGFNAAWDNLPKFKADNSGNINQLLFVRSKIDKETGLYKVKVKLREPEIESEIKYLTITKFVPSPTPTKPEPTPTMEIIPTPEPLPTSPSEEISPESTSVLGLSDSENLSPTVSPIKISKSGSNIIPTILISVGGILLLVPLLVSKIRDGK